MMFKDYFFVARGDPPLAVKSECEKMNNQLMKIIDPRSIIDKWVGTPYGYRMATPSIGVDCAHLVITIIEEARGVSEIVIPNYPRSWRLSDPALFERSLASLEMKHQIRTILEHDIEFADIALMTDNDGRIKHAAAIIDRASLIHITDDESIPSVRIEPISRYRDRIIRFIRIEK